MTHQTVQIGVVGGGFGASFQWHLHPQCRVTAVCDRAQAGVDQLCRAYGPAATYQDFGDFLCHPALEAVALFTPAPEHSRMAIQAMDAGKHVISAVPAGITVGELERLLDCVKRTGLKYMMAETSYYHPEIITCREMARDGAFGTLFYAEAEYHHEGLNSLMFDPTGAPTWRYGFPPMLYPTHCTGMVIPVMGEHLVEVQAIGWGDGHEILRANRYDNPFWNTTAFFKTSGGYAARIAVYWHVAAGGTERAQFYGDRMSFIMARPEGSPDTLVRIGKAGETLIDANGYPQGDLSIQRFETPRYFERLPEPMRVRTGHGNSHTFLSYEFIQAILEDRSPAVDIYEAIAYTLPGIIAHQSALRDGESMRIPDHGTAAGPAH